MTDAPAPSAAESRNRWLIMNFFRLLGVAGGVFGVILMGRADLVWMKVLGVAILLSAIYMAWTIPAALAHRWASPGNVQTNRRRPKKINK